MEFEDSFEVPVDLDVAWEALTDIERVYPCLPGAELRGVKDNEFEGLVTLRFGPITAVYQGSARIDDLDPDNHTLVIYAQGRDKHGQGTARARVSAKLIPEGDVTRVQMNNEVEITGKAAQFGRGILQDVSKEILGEFASNLQAVVTPGPALGQQTRKGREPGPSHAPPAKAQSISVVSLGGRVAARRMRESPGRTAAAGVAVAAIVAVIVWLLSR